MPRYSIKEPCRWHKEYSESCLPCNWYRISSLEKQNSDLVRHIERLEMDKQYLMAEKGEK